MEGAYGTFEGFIEVLEEVEEGQLTKIPLEVND